MKHGVASSMFVRGQEPVLGVLIITAEEVRIFLLLAVLIVQENMFLNHSRQLNFIFCFIIQIKMSFYLFAVNSSKHLVPLPWPNKQSAHCGSVGQLKTVCSFC